MSVDKASQAKDETILALQEVVNDLLAKLVNFRVQAGLQLKEKDREIASLKAALQTQAVPEA
jgi:ribosomal protein L29